MTLAKSHNITFQVSSATHFKAKQLRISLKTLAASLVEWWINDYESHVGKELMLSMMSDEITKLEKEIINIKLKEAMLERLKQELDIMKHELEDDSRSVEYQDLITALNKKIIGNHYDINAIQEKYSSTIRLISTINPTFDLQTHVTKVRLLREDLDTSKVVSFVASHNVEDLTSI